MLRPRAAAGFTMVEVLVTLFVVAIGLLTAAGLQAVSKKAAFEAMQRTTATVLAQDMLERVRSNSSAIASYSGKTVSKGDVPTAPTCGSTNDCTEAADLVALDYFQWWQSLEGAAEQIADGSGETESAGGLRSPVGCVRQESGWVEIIIEWRGLTAIDQTPDEDNPDDPTAATCGSDQDDYEPDGDVSFRRVLRLQAHIKTT